MAKTTFQILAAIALAATGGLTIVATNGDSDGESKSFMRHIHELGHRIHGGGHHGAGHMDKMAEMIDQLDLDAEQLQHLDKFHQLLGSRGEGHAESMEELHNQLVAQFRQGRIETDAIRKMIDSHVEQIRANAYAMTDELIALVNSLDADQRAIVLTHLEAIPGPPAGSGI